MGVGGGGSNTLRFPKSFGFGTGPFPTGYDADVPRAHRRVSRMSRSRLEARPFPAGRLEQGPSTCKKWGHSDEFSEVRQKLRELAPRYLIIFYLPLSLLSLTPLLCPSFFPSNTPILFPQKATSRGSQLSSRAPVGTERGAHASRPACLRAISFVGCWGLFFRPFETGSVRAQHLGDELD